MKMAVTPFHPPYPKTPCYMQTSWLCFIEPELSKFFIAVGLIGIFDLFCSCNFDPMSFIYELNPYSFEMNRICENELPIRQGLRKLSSDRHTDSHDRNHTRCFVGGQKVVTVQSKQLAVWICSLLINNDITLHCIRILFL